MKAFHAYDIRGVYNEDVYKIGFFLPVLLETDKILVGRDTRISSPEIFEYLCKGINDSGADVYNVGLATTPMVYWGTAMHGFMRSVQITASHNSKEYNGLKVSRKDAIPVGFDTGLGDLKHMVESQKITPVAIKGKIYDFDIKEDYIAFQKQYVADFSSLRIAIDCSNGMAGLLIKDLLGEQPEYMYSELDGTFPNHDPNPLNEKNVAI